MEVQGMQKTAQKEPVRNKKRKSDQNDNDKLLEKHIDKVIEITIKSLIIKQKLLKNAIDSEDWKLAFDLEKDIYSKELEIAKIVSLGSSAMLIEIFMISLVEVYDIFDDVERFKKFMETLKVNLSKREETLKSKV